MKFSSIALAAIFSALGVIVPTAAFAQETWSEYPTSDCATSVAPNWVIGCQTNPSYRQVYENSGGTFNAISGAYAVAITADFTGNPWVVNDAGTIYNWTGSTFATFDSSKTWVKVAVGSPTTAGDIWAIDSSGQIWSNSGTATSKGAWTPIYGAFGTKIALFSETHSCFGATTHVAWVINSANNVYQYNCASFSQFPGAAGIDITTDLVLGTNSWVYNYNGSTFVALLSPPSGGLTSIGGNNGGSGSIWAINSSGNIFSNLITQ